MPNVPLLVLSNSGGTGTGNTGTGNTAYPGAGVTKGVYREILPFNVASTHTAQTIFPFAQFTRPCTIKSLTVAWTEVNAANTTKATVDVLKRSQSGAAAGTTVLATVATLTNNATTQTRSTVSTAFTPTLNTGSANVNPVLSATASALAVSAGDSLCFTTVATSTQGVDLSGAIEVEYNLNDEVASANLL